MESKNSNLNSNSNSNEKKIVPEISVHNCSSGNSEESALTRQINF